MSDTRRGGSRALGQPRVGRRTDGICRQPRRRASRRGDLGVQAHDGACVGGLGFVRRGGSAPFAAWTAAPTASPLGRLSSRCAVGPVQAIAAPSQEAAGEADGGAERREDTPTDKAIADRDLARVTPGLRLQGLVARLETRPRDVQAVRSAPGRIRTSDPRIRSPPLCPLSYGRVKRRVPPYFCAPMCTGAAAPQGRFRSDAADGTLCELRGGGSSVGRAPGCGPGGRGFESRSPPSPEPASEAGLWAASRAS